MCSLPASCRNTNTIVFYAFSANATPPSESQTTKWSQWQQALSTIYVRNENREDSPKIHYGPIKLRQTCIYCALLLLLLCLCALTSVWHTQCKHTKITTEKDNFGACLRNCSFHKAWHVFFLVFYNTMLSFLIRLFVYTEKTRILKWTNILPNIMPFIRISKTIFMGYYSCHCVCNIKRQRPYLNRYHIQYTPYNAIYYKQMKTIQNPSDISKYC